MLGRSLAGVTSWHHSNMSKYTHDILWAYKCQCTYQCKVGAMSRHHNMMRIAQSSTSGSAHLGLA
eukprot:1815629-Amphidinium_carterae.1